MAKEAFERMDMEIDLILEVVKNFTQWEFVEYEEEVSNKLKEM